MSYVGETLTNLLHQTAFFNLTWGNYVMILVAFIFLYLAIKKGFEPLLLVPIAFGMLLVNIYPDIIASPEQTSNGVGGLLYYFYTLDEWSILPSLIFMGVGAMTDFGPMLRNLRLSIFGAAAQLGIFTGDAVVKITPVAYVHGMEVSSFGMFSALYPPGSGGIG